MREYFTSNGFSYLDFEDFLNYTELCEIIYV